MLGPDALAQESVEVPVRAGALQDQLYQLEGCCAGEVRLVDRGPCGTKERRGGDPLAAPGVGHSASVRRLPLNGLQHGWSMSLAPLAGVMSACLRMRALEPVMTREALPGHIDG